jgi:type VI protein secretion system component Hcp
MKGETTMQHLFRTVCTAGFALVVVFTMLMPSPAEAAAYIKIAGVEGESRAKDHKDEIEILSWQWGVSPAAGATVASTAAASSGTSASAAAKSAPARATTGSGAVDPTPAQANRKRQHEPIRFTKRVDKSSPLLQKANADHQVFPSMTLSLPDPDGASNSYLVYELKEVIITSYQTSGPQGGDTPTESITLNYAKMKEIKKGAADITD